MMAERRKILRMLREHKLTVEEAEELLDASERQPDVRPSVDINYVTANPKTQQVLNEARAAAPSDSAVLVMGEPGTGKELIARLIHENSPRRDQPLSFLNCLAIPETLLEAEVFGYVRAAFTGAQQDKPGLLERTHTGTLVLDAVEALPLNLQAKLLRFLDTGEFERIGGTQRLVADVRLIALAYKDLMTEVEAERFRQTLYFRLAPFALTVPPLRERPEDIPLLVHHFLERQADKLDQVAPAVTPEVMQVLESYHWPGNVRELVSTIERAHVLSGGEDIGLDHLPDGLFTPTLADTEREAIEEALKSADGNKSLAAEALGIPLRTLYRKLKESGIE